MILDGANINFSVERHTGILGTFTYLTFLSYRHEAYIDIPSTSRKSQHIGLNDLQYLLLEAARTMEGAIGAYARAKKQQELCESGMNYKG